MVRFDDFHNIDPDTHVLFQNLMVSSIQQANSFLSFVFLWMAFNGWIAAITGEETDAGMIASVAGNSRLSTAYDALISANPDFAALVTRFSELWPVFDARDARKKAVHATETLDYSAAARRAGVKHRPQNWHTGATPDWDQVLRTIYMVRCNLFHGRKSPQNDRDRELVAKSYEVLSAFLDRTGCISWRDM